MKTIRMIVIAVTVASMPAASAGPCTIWHSNTDLVRVGTNVLAAPRAIEDCSAIQYHSGKPVACYLDSLGRRFCAAVGSSHAAGESVADPSAASVAIQIATGDTGSVSGRKRFKGSPELTAFPHGDVLRPSGSLRIKATDEHGNRILHFALFPDDQRTRPVFTSNGSASIIEIPAAILSPGRQFHWTARSGRERFTGRFRVADRREQSEVEEEIRKSISQSEDSRRTRLTIRAMYYEDYGYHFDRDLVLRALKEN